MEVSACFKEIACLRPSKNLYQELCSNTENVIKHINLKVDIMV